MSKNFSNFNYILTVIILSLCIIFIMPALAFFVGYLIGWIIKVTIGSLTVNCINTIFGTAFGIDILPKIGGLLGLVSIFLPSKSISLKQKKGGKK